MYNCDTLEQFLEEASYRLPVAVLGRFITRAENLIAVNGNTTELETEIQKALYEAKHGRRMFSIKNLVANDAIAGNEDGVVYA